MDKKRILLHLIIVSIGLFLAFEQLKKKST